MSSPARNIVIHVRAGFKGLARLLLTPLATKTCRCSSAGEMAVGASGFALRRICLAVGKHKGAGKLLLSHYLRRSAHRSYSELD